jgi:hypothetical protein
MVQTHKFIFVQSLRLSVLNTAIIWNVVWLRTSTVVCITAFTKWNREYSTRDCSVYYVNNYYVHLALWNANNSLLRSCNYFASSFLHTIACLGITAAPLNYDACISWSEAAGIRLKWFGTFILYFHCVVSYQHSVWHCRTRNIGSVAIAT